MISFFLGQDAIYFDVGTNRLIAFDLQFHAIIYLFEQGKLY